MLGIAAFVGIADTIHEETHVPHDKLAVEIQKKKLMDYVEMTLFRSLSFIARHFVTFYFVVVAMLNDEMSQISFQFRFFLPFITFDRC